MKHENFKDHTLLNMKDQFIISQNSSREYLVKQKRMS